MPREDDHEIMSGGKQTPEPANESSQSPEPVSEVTSETRESSLEPLAEETSSNDSQSPRDSATSESVIEDSVCPKCGGKRVESNSDLEPIRKSNSDGDLPKSVSGVDQAALPQSKSDEDLKPSSESQLTCKCSLEEVKDEKRKSNQGNDRERRTEKAESENQSLAVHEKSSDHSAQETICRTLDSVSEKKDVGIHLTGESDSDNRSLMAPEKSPTVQFPDQQIASDSVEDTSCSVSVKENEVQETAETQDENPDLSAPVESSTEIRRAGETEENKSLAAPQESSTGNSQDQKLSGDSVEENSGPTSELVAESEKETALQSTETDAEDRSLTAPKKPSEQPLEQGQESSSDSVEDTSGSTTSDSPSENFAVITCIRAPPRSPARTVQQRRRCGSPLDEVSIPLERCPLVHAATGEIALVEEGRVRNRANESRTTLTSREYKSMLKVVGLVIALVFTILIALLVAAQISFDRRHGINSNSTEEDLDRNSVAEDE